MKRDDHMRKFEWKKKNRQQSHMCGNKGYTLVELIVTFALLAIFMTAVVACLPNITKIYTNLQAINHQKTICNTVSNQIRNELQSTLGVEGADDALGVQNVNGKGYIALIDDSGHQIMIPTGGAVSTGGAILPASDLTGDTIEFVLRDGIIAQLDAKGFNGYTMRKKKLQVDYHDAKAISSGALLTRYYQTDGDYNKKLTVIDYKSGVYAVATEAGIVTEGLKNVAYAIEYPYAKPFYEGYELKTKFTIKKDAFYTYGDGTTASPARTYVNYINYTLSLWKDGHMKYSQDYVVNVQNAVPYLGTKVASDPVVPDVPEEPEMKETYIVPGSLKPHEIYPGPNPDAMYDMKIRIATNSALTNWHDYWEITIPTNSGIHLKEAFFAGEDGSNMYYSPVFEMTKDLENNKIKLSLKAGIGFIDMSEFTIRFKVSSDDGKLFEEKRDLLDGTKALHMEQKVPLADSLNSNTSCKVYDGNHVEINIQPTIAQTKSYVRLEYDSDVDQVNAMYNTTNMRTEVDGKYIYIYARMTSNGNTDRIDLAPTFKSEGTHNLVSVYVGDSLIPPPYGS